MSTDGTFGLFALQIGEAAMEEPFEPKILAFCCHYCAYAAADLAGVMRLNYPTGVRIVEVPCSGRVEVSEILHAFERGADGVMVAGCLEGECHYLEGNIHAKRRVKYAAEWLDKIGLGGERVRMFNLSSAMAVQFAEYVREMTETVRKLGPSPLRKNT